jgi:DNA-binding response OmpR family regulator
MNKKILVVDDELPIIRLLTLRLKANNFEVISAHDGYECVEKAKSELPDLILLDIKMPGGGGISAFKNLKEIENTKSIPVIFITAYPSAEIKKMVMDMGAQGFIAKPFDTEFLTNSVNEVLFPSSNEN